MKRIAVVTTNRAEFGALYWLLHSLHTAADFELQLLVGGSHLLQETGYTLQDIEASGLPITAQLPFQTNANLDDLCAQVSLATAQTAACLRTHQPDLLILTGDRYELLGIASAALLCNVPIAHISGGELTEGAMDDAIRHALTKLGYWHWVAHPRYRQRVIQLGEAPERVFVVGEPGLEHCLRTPLLSPAELLPGLGFAQTKPLLMMTYHPETWSTAAPVDQLNTVLNALPDWLASHNLIITYPNSDRDAQAMIARLHAFADQYPGQVSLTPSLGIQRYLSALALADVLLGNSSSGIYEAPSYQTVTVNIGERQRGRLRAASVIDTPCTTAAIQQAIAAALAWRATHRFAANPYGDGHTAARILSILREQPFPTGCRKTFYDLENGS